MLELVLLKAALFLGVKVHTGVEFKQVVEPKGERGWRADVSPHTCPVSSYSYDIMVGADGKKYVLPGFRTKEFRPKLAIAITANFINHYTQEEARVPEISGIAYIYHQEFFNNLRDHLGIELENLVYYKDETHYFVMTTKKQSLLAKKVLKQVCPCKLVVKLVRASPVHMLDYVGVARGSQIAVLCCVKKDWNTIIMIFTVRFAV